MDIFEIKRRSIASAVEAINGDPYERVTKTYFAGMDTILGRGFKEGQLILAGGRPSMGKTAFAIGLVKEIAVEHKQPVVYFSLEGSAEHIMERIIMLESGINRMGKEEISYSEKQDVVKAAERLDEAPVILVDHPYAGFDYIMDKCLNEFRERVNPRLIIIDYLQLMDTYSKETPEDILRDLKFLAKEMHCPILLLSQLDRDVDSDSREDHRPTLKDISGVVDVEELVDVVIFLYRDSYYNPHPEDKEKAEIIIAKNTRKENKIGTITVKFRNGFFRDCYEM